MKSSPWRVLAAACMSAIGAAIFVLAVSNDSAGQKDFIEYWSSGWQLVHRANPYDAAAIMRLERSAGFQGDRALISFSPPVVLVLALPLGMLSAKAGVIVWLLLILAALVGSIRMIRALHGFPDNRLHLLGYCFAPVLACLMAGQLGIFMLFGIVVFLRYSASRPFLAGAALLPCALKPHLFAPVAVVLILWSARRRQFRVLSGVLAVLAVGCVLVTCADPAVWTQYVRMMSLAKPMDLFIPTLSTVLRILIDRQADWLQFLPEAGACLWAGWFFMARRRGWDWNREGLLVLLVSAVCTPYAFFSDEAILLPAVLAAVYWAYAQDRSLVPFGVLAGAALLQVFFGVQMTSAYFLWTTPAWLAWYLFATRPGPSKPTGISPAAARGF